MIVKGERLKRAIFVALADIESQKILELIRYASNVLIPLYFLMYGLLKGIKMIQRMVPFSYILVTKI